MLLLATIVLSAGPIYSLYAAGPCSLLVNLRRRTYRFKKGFPLLAMVTEGSLEDIVGLYFNGPYKQGYIISLKWKKPRYLDALLGESDFFLGAAATDGEAQAQTMQIADKLGVPPSRFGSIKLPDADKRNAEALPWHHLHDRE